MTNSSANQKLVVCIRNDDYEASLELRKIYEIIPDDDAEAHNQLRVIDESGEDYLFPSSLFMPIELPESTKDAVIRAA
ncbi:MAG: hypothetical protein U5O39_19955 [Gammaproteobacteria bacterium]|nr:hypothetical protein [Gammaproteobacteria bacterium]